VDGCQVLSGEESSLCGGDVGHKSLRGQDVFHLLSERHNHQIFDVQNGTTFVQSTDGKGTINFVVPPIGGADSEGAFTSAIHQLDGQPRFTVTGAELSAPLTHTKCVSYIDNDQP
jgi:hypothetical protein